MGGGQRIRGGGGERLPGEERRRGRRARERG